MLDVIKKLPDDPTASKALIAAMASELTNLDAELKSRDVLSEKLKHQLASLCSHQFGSRSENFDQLKSTLEEEEVVRAVESSSPEPSSDDVDEKC